MGSLAASSEAAVLALELRGIEKRFGAVHANRAVNFAVARGSIHGLVGENGAGKSTLMAVAYGEHRPDAGEIFVAGKSVQFAAPSDAIAAGIGLVHQHFMLVDTFTVLENVVLGAEDGAILRRGLDRARDELQAMARDYGLEVPLDVPVGELPVGVQQRVEILKALYRRAQVLVLDEPTAVLTPQEADGLFVLLRRLRDEGRSVVLVTHKLREVLAVTDRVTVMRQGAVIAEFATADTSTTQLAECMVGRPVLLHVETKPAQPGAALLSVRDLRVRDERGVERVRGASFAVRAGEIVGLAGVSGNGQSELLEAIAGIRDVAAGAIELAGRDLVAAGLGVRARRALGLAHVPEDRLRMGVVREFSAEENGMLGRHDQPPYVRAGLLRPAAIRADCVAKMASHDIRPALPSLAITRFSGGNQQKLVVAREIESGPQVLLVGQPTRGVDIGASEAIHRRLVALRDAGKAVLLVSVELDEILALADRILVMHAGAIVADLPRAEATEAKLGLWMAGVNPAGTA